MINSGHWTFGQIVSNLQVDNKSMVDLCENILFVFNVFRLLQTQNFGYRHDFECVVVARRLVSNNDDSAERARANGVQQLELVNLALQAPLVHFVLVEGSGVGENSAGAASRVGCRGACII